MADSDNKQPSLWDHDSEPVWAITSITRRLVDARLEILDEPLESADYQHTILCQVGCRASRRPAASLSGERPGRHDHGSRAAMAAKGVG